MFGFWGDSGGKGVEFAGEAVEEDGFVFEVADFEVEEGGVFDAVAPAQFCEGFYELQAEGVFLVTEPVFFLGDDVQFHGGVLRVCV